MHIVSYRSEGSWRAGIVQGSFVADAAALVPPSSPSTVRALLEAGSATVDRLLDRARDAFERAQGLYTDAGNEIRTALAGAKQNPPVTDAKVPEKKETASSAAEKAEIAKRDIRQMVDSYRNFIEKGDLQGLSNLLNLTDADRDNWSKFFDLSEKRSLTIAEVEPDLNRDDPVVSFREKLSFYNTSTRQNVSPPEQKRTWSLQEGDHGTWKVISYK